MTQWEDLTVLQIIETLRDRIVSIGEYVARLETEALEAEHEVERLGRSVQGWTDEAARYAENADYWRARTGAADLVVGEAAMTVRKIQADPTSVAWLLTADLRRALAAYDRWREGSNDRAKDPESAAPGGPAAEDGQGAGPS